METGEPQARGSASGKGQAIGPGLGGSSVGGWEGEGGHRERMYPEGAGSRKVGLVLLHGSRDGRR